MNIYVGNLPYSISENDLRDMFAEFGEVARANIIMDRDTGRSKGFAASCTVDDIVPTLIAVGENGESGHSDQVVANGRNKPQPPSEHPAKH